MNEPSYLSNYKSALCFLQENQKDTAFEVLQRALSQVPENEMTVDNATYLNILARIAFLLLERHEPQRAYEYVIKGLEVKKDHADLLFMKSLSLFDLHWFDEMMDAIINYFLALDKEDAHSFDYRFVNEGIFRELFGVLIPKAYKCAFQHEQIRELVQKLYKVTGNVNLGKTYEIMIDIDNTRTETEN